MADHLQLSPAELLDLVEAGEPNPLLRKIDALCGLRAWDDLVAMAAQCREATERGKQLWPIAEHVDYRLALEAPPDYAAAVLHPTAGRFAAGPLTEVAASTHTFDELRPHLSLPSTAGVVAAERVLRGEDLRDRPDAHPEIMDMPMRLEPWEPTYVVATYKSSSVEVPAPELPPLRREAAGRPGPEVGDDELAAVLLDVVEAWISGSNARAEVSISESVDEAIGNLGVDSFWTGDITAEQGMALIAWAGASGGAHGRRRGAAAGRSAAWWAASALTALEWPPDPAELGDAIRELRWYRWEPKALAGGWHLHLAVASPDGDWVAALAVEDRAE